MRFLRHFGSTPVRAHTQTQAQTQRQTHTHKYTHTQARARWHAHTHTHTHVEEQHSWLWVTGWLLGLWAAPSRGPGGPGDSWHGAGWHHNDRALPWQQTSCDRPSLTSKPAVSCTCAHKPCEGWSHSRGCWNGAVIMVSIVSSSSLWCEEEQMIFWWCSVTLYLHGPWRFRKHIFTLTNHKHTAT